MQSFYKIPIAGLFLVFCSTVLGQMPQFAFWKAQAGISFPTHSCASITGTQTFTSNTSIDDAAISTHQCKHWVVNTGVTLTFATNTQAPIGDLTLNGTAQITHSPCTTSQCYQVYIYAKGDVTIPSGAKIHADEKGYLGGSSGGNSSCKGRTNGNTTTGGPGCTNWAGGASHGGYGGDGSWGGDTANSPYGSIVNPVTYGAGGAKDSVFPGSGGEGGGVIRLLAAGTLTLDGIISANGGNGSSGAGGAGGSIWIKANMISTGSSGLRISANGGDGSGTDYGNGGGGRIALEYNGLNTFSINSTYVTAFGQSSSASKARSHAGTIYALERTSAKIYIHNNDITAPANYETQIDEPLNLVNFEVLGRAVVKQMSSSNPIAIQGTATVTSPAVMRVPHNGTINSTGPWTWFTYGTLSGTITEY